MVGEKGGSWISLSLALMPAELTQRCQMQEAEAPNAKTIPAPLELGGHKDPCPKVCGGDFRLDITIISFLYISKFNNVKLNRVTVAPKNTHPHTSSGVKLESNLSISQNVTGIKAHPAQHIAIRCNDRGICALLSGSRESCRSSTIPSIPLRSFRAIQIKRSSG